MPNWFSRRKSPRIAQRPTRTLTQSNAPVLSREQIRILEHPTYLRRQTTIPGLASAALQTGLAPSIPSLQRRGSACQSGT